MAAHNDFGKESEQEAVIYLENNEYTILERNYIYQSAEIDIIAQKGNILVISIFWRTLFFCKSSKNETFSKSY